MNLKSFLNSLNFIEIMAVLSCAFTLIIILLDDAPPLC